MSLRSLVTAFADGARTKQEASFKVSDTGVVRSRRAKPKSASEKAARPAVGERTSTAAFSVVKKGSDAWWNAQGGPWCAVYHHLASLTAVGVFEGNPYRVHFMDPFDALEHFRQLPDRYRTDATLRGSCKIVYKDNWYMVEPFADDADHAVDVLRDEVARDRASGAAT